MIDWSSIGKLLLFFLCTFCIWALVEQSRQINSLNYAVHQLQTTERQGFVTKNELVDALNRQEAINYMIGEYLSELLKRNELKNKQSEQQKPPKFLWPGNLDNRRNKNLQRVLDGTILYKI